MEEYESKMTNGIGRSRMVIQDKIKKMEHANKAISDKVTNANKKSHEDLMKRMK